MAIQFPNNPTLNQTYTYNSITWTYNGKGWTKASAGIGGGLSANVFFENSQSVSSNYTITAGKSATSAGPISISNGVVVTIPSGSKWVVL